ncbi:hypothetical protein [Flavobacterium gelatinilyticum]|uniref:hypothetical protein n=1 Tax=Flavobacterium gelatinilyticum TaxID=3003260 RepID=UPI0024814EEF|nr:hypothetical protein [Flavobacterium gelatinilyticum]
MSEILKNIKQIADNELITITKLEKLIGASKGVLSRAIAQNSDIQTKWITKIVEVYPHYNCEWLIKNEGYMLKSQNTATDENNSYKELAEARLEIIKLKNEKIEHLTHKLQRIKESNNQDKKHE